MSSCRRIPSPITYSFHCFTQSKHSLKEIFLFLQPGWCLWGYVDGDLFILSCSVSLCNLGFCYEVPDSWGRTWTWNGNLRHETVRTCDASRVFYSLISAAHEISKTLILPHLVVPEYRWLWYWKGLD